MTVSNEVMEDLLHKLRLTQKAIYILDDYSINLLNCYMHQYSGNFLEIMFYHSLTNFINRPTRVTANSATINDNIYSNEMRNDQLTGILYTDMSDHFPIFIIDYSCTTYDQPQYIVKRHNTCDNISKCENTLKEIDFSSILDSNDPQHAFTNFHDFHDIFSQAHDICIPSKIIKMNYRNKKTWLTNGLKNSIKRKNKLYVKSIKPPTVHNVNQYKAYQMMLITVLKKNEQDYQDSQFNYNKNNLKKCWTLSKRIINRKSVVFNLVNSFLMTTSRRTQAR